MKINLITVVLILTITTIIYGQEQNRNWEKFNYLIGNWKGEGSGKPGEGEGYFSFKFDLNNKIIIRDIRRNIISCIANPYTALKRANITRYILP